MQGIRMKIAKYITGLSIVPVFLAALSSSSQVLFAETYISPERVEIKTPVLKPEASEFEPMLGTYNYSVSWEGIPAADLTATVEQVNGNYRVTAKAKTYTGIDLFYKLRYKAEGLISAVDFFPVKTTIDLRENSRHKYTEIKFDAKGNVDALRVDYKKDQINTLSFDPENFMLDPFAAAFLARSIKWEEGISRDFDTFNGKSRYLISLTATEKTKMKVNGVEKDVWVISPKVVNLSIPEQTGKLRKAEIYVTADKARDIVKIKSSVFIGSVYTELDSVEPAPQQMMARYAANNAENKAVK
jgi:hypothetical protein